MSNLCQRCLQRLKHYGSVNGRRLKPEAYAAEKSKAVAFLAKYRGHVAVLAAFTVIEHELLRLPELARLRAAAVEPGDVLAELIAVYLYSLPRLYAREEQGPWLTFGLADAVLHLAPRESYRARSGARRYRAIPYATRRHVADALRILLRFLGNAAEAIKLHEHTMQQARRALHTPIPCNNDAQP